MKASFGLYFLAFALVTAPGAAPQKTVQDWLEAAKGHLATGQTLAAVDAYTGALGETLLPCVWIFFLKLFFVGEKKELDPTDALTLYKRAVLQLGLQKRASAVKDLGSVLTLKPTFSQVALMF